LDNSKFYHEILDNDKHQIKILLKQLNRLEKKTHYFLWSISLHYDLTREDYSFVRAVAKAAIYRLSRVISFINEKREEEDRSM